ncbi:MAG: hypothetical protein H0T42_16025 [Deltaproteobacteria bacterium]|nr:hypothetical protein [Deltaproteobacteria bacterium]
MGADSAFVDLRRLADWFGGSPHRSSLLIERLVQRLGATAIPLLGRELRSADSRRREASRSALADLAVDDSLRARVISELRAITASELGGDEIKVCALGLLAELGERGAARFSDPNAIQQRSAIALARQIGSEADVASAADLMVRQLDENDMVQMLEVMAEPAPLVAHRLATELAMRLDLPLETRERVTATMTATPIPERIAGPAERRRSSRPTQVAVLVDASARLVVVASKKVTGERRWRRWAVLIGATGRIEDCLHEDDGDDDADAAPLIANLCADGYRVASTALEHARRVVATAAKLTASSPRPDGTSALTSAYYLGRDLLDLAGAHLGERASQPAATLARALEHLADGESVRAEALLARCDAANPDVAAARAAILLARNEPAAALEAIEALGRALAVEPDWPLHHWNLAVALRQLGDPSGCFHALRRFVTTSALPTGLYADPDQPGRVACAERMMANLERAARVTGTSLRRRRRRTTSTKKSRAIEP